MYWKKNTIRGILYVRITSVRRFPVAFDNTYFRAFEILGNPVFRSLVHNSRKAFCHFSFRKNPPSYVPVSIFPFGAESNRQMSVAIKPTPPYVWWDTQIIQCYCLPISFEMFKHWTGWTSFSRKALYNIICTYVWTDMYGRWRKSVKFVCVHVYVIEYLMLDNTHEVWCTYYIKYIFECFNWNIYK